MQVVKSVILLAMVKAAAVMDVTNLNAIAWMRFMFLLPGWRWRAWFSTLAYYRPSLAGNG